MSKVLITGANGLIGSHICEYFVDRGIQVVCLVRSSNNQDFLNKLDVEIIDGDITDIESVCNCISDEIDFIIHTAAKVSDWGDYEEFYSTNVDGTMNILYGGWKKGVKNFIITGSISCYGEENSKTVKNEDSGYNSHYNYFMDKIFPSGMNHYRDSKAESNLKAIEFAIEKRINLTILEPAWVYGEREFHSGFYDFVSSVKKGIRFMPGSKQNKFHTIYARNLAKIYYLAYTKELSGINSILAVDSEVHFQTKIFNMFCQEAGLKIPFRIPKLIIYPPAFLMELIYSALRTKKGPLLSRARVNMFYDNIQYSDKKLKELLDYSPDFTLEEAINKTVKWYKDNQYL